MDKGNTKSLQLTVPWNGELAMAWIRYFLLTLTLTLISCGAGSDAGQDSEPDSSPQDTFWTWLADHCGESYAGKATVAPEGDTQVAGKDLKMHIRECGEHEIRVPFHVGENRSRTWVLTRSESSISLAHQHLHEDGTPESNSGYGGETVVAGTGLKQSFPRGRPAGELEHPDNTSVWGMEIDPENEIFIYTFQRTGTDRRYRVEFDLTATVPTPLPPWGS
tara:strand:+ start:6325 stop:6984 length:660 start_codon:yes stop_codon:yes gene_type:complete